MVNPCQMLCLKCTFCFFHTWLTLWLQKSCGHWCICVHTIWLFLCKSFLRITGKSAKRTYIQLIIWMCKKFHSHRHVKDIKSIINSLAFSISFILPKRIVGMTIHSCQISWIKTSSSNEKPLTMAMFLNIVSRQNRCSIPQNYFDNVSLYIDFNEQNKSGIE